MKPAPNLPRIGPPLPRRNRRMGAWEGAAKALGRTPMPWQNTAGRYLCATTGRDGHYRYPEVAIVASRQNGKTDILDTTIVDGLDRGERILHTAQNRGLPRETFIRLAARAPALFPGRLEDIRWANGQESIELTNGGRYYIVSDRQGSGRGLSAIDRVIIDEVREQDDFDLLAVLAPTLLTSPNAQRIYLSNAGDATSLILNDLRRRGIDGDPDLAYLEWSAPPDYQLPEPKGHQLTERDLAAWRSANPAMGYTVTAARLEHLWRTLPRSVFETEHLCRWVVSKAPPLVRDAAWGLCRADVLSSPRNARLGISVHPSGRRASAALAWVQPDGTVALTLAADVTGDPIDLDAFGAELRRQSAGWHVTEVGFDPWTDRDLARYFGKKAKPIAGQVYANASARFVSSVDTGRLRWSAVDPVTADLPWTVRKTHDVGAWHAVAATDERPVPAALAAVRAVWLATAPTRSAKVY